MAQRARRRGKGDQARRQAFSILRDFFAGREARVDRRLRRARLPDPRDRGLCREMVLGVLRHASLYDAVVDALGGIADDDPDIRISLRLAVQQLAGMDRIPAHAVGATTGDLLRWRGRHDATAAANAAIRDLSARIEARGGRGDPLARLPTELLPGDPAVRHNLPALLLADLAPMLAEPGRDPADLNRMPEICTRVLPGAGIADDPVIVRREHHLVWWSDPRRALHGPVAEGRAVVQDPAQAAAVALAAPAPGERVLDCCAAPGGKARLAAECGAKVVAADHAVGKVRTMRRDLPDAIAVLVQDARRPALDADFDLVLCDVPCSNSGVLGRRPEARYRYDRAHLDSLAELQRALLEAAAACVAPGGRLCYSTCSLTPRENRAVVDDLEGWGVADERLSWPDRWQGGGYAAVLVRE